jgi:hypothetical protein
MKQLRTIGLLATILFIVFGPSLALGQAAESAPPADVTIIAPEPPPPSTDWKTLVAVGTLYVFTIVELAKKNIPALKGWLVWGALLPIVAGVAIYQVGLSSPLLLAKHAGLLLLTAVGGRAGVLKLFEYAVRAWNAYQAGQSIPPPPEFGTGGPSSLPPVSKAPKTPTLPGATAGIVLLTVALGLAGCTREAFLSRAVPVANTLEGQVRTAGVDVNRDCEVPMQRAADTNDKVSAREIAARCDEPVLAYEGSRMAHLLLTEAIMQVYKGGDVGAAVALIPQAVDAGLRLVAGVKALQAGAK